MGARRTAELRWCMLVLVSVFFVSVVLGEGVARAGTGSMWKPVNGGLDGAAVTAIARGQTVLVGTQRDGIYVWEASTTSWKASNSGLQSRSAAGGSAFPSIQSLAVNQADMRRVVAGTTEGVYLSLDSGATWRRTGQGVLPADCRCVMLDGRVPGLIVVGTSVGVYRSEDFGSEWAHSADTLVDQAISFVSLDARNTKYVYAGTSEGLYRSLDGGVTWRRLNRSLLDKVSALMQDAENPEILTVGTTYGIMRSVDGGTNWQSVAGGTGCGAVLGFGPWIDGAAVVAICRNGIIVSRNGGDSWSAPVELGVPTGEFLSGVALGSGSVSLLLGTAGGVYFVSQSGSVLQSSGLGSPASGAVAYSGTTNQFFVIRGTGLYSSVGPEVWTQVGRDVGSMGINALASHPTQRKVLFAGCDLGLLISNDGGAGWSLQSPKGVTGRVRALTPDRSGQLLLVATDTGIYGGDPTIPAGWKPYQGAPADCSALAWSQMLADRVYALASGRIYVSDDRGQKWIAWSQNLAAYGVLSCAVHRTSEKSEEILLGTTDGVWRLPDSGSAPERLGQGLEGTPVVGICCQSAVGGGIVAGTPRGVYCLATEADVTAPAIVIDSPLSGQTLHSQSVEVRGVVVDHESGIKSVLVQGTVVSLASNGSFSCTLALGLGNQSIKVVAADVAGNTSSLTVQVTILPYVELTLYIGSTLMQVDGRSVPLDSPPTILSGRTLVPIRPIVEALGGQISWNAERNQVDVALDGHSVQLWIGNSMARVDGVSVHIDENAKVVPIISGGRTMLPLRFVVESVGAEVMWDAVLRKITIRYSSPRP